AIEEANICVLSPPPVEGLGNAGGFKMMVQDTGGVGYVALEQAANQLAGAAAQNPKLVGVFGQFNTGAPRLAADVDRERALLLGVEPAEVFQTLGTYLGSTYVNDFNMLGRTFRVTAQAEPSGRSQVSDIANLKVRTASGGMAPLGTIATLRDDSGPARVVRFNLYPSAEILGGAAPGISSGEALAEMERLAAETLPTGVSFQWTELAYQEQAAGDTTLLVFAMAVVFVFLVLAAQYEAFTLPLAVVLIVPMCILAAMVGVNLAGLDNNILVQVGLVVLIALAAKNAILIVEFAKQAEDEGLNRWDAAVRASRTRLRPILMTSFAFIFGVLPLMLATGPGAEMRQSLGTAVVSGMIGVTFFGLIFTPAFYVFMRWVASKLPGGKKKAAPETRNPTPATAPNSGQGEIV
ncbi:MAG TPA: hydrophobe/amphiphile efflux-1 family RND transporter, partial [Brevundimonas sp.]|nr:hydrophobe/amphiphile efflux-1 family RND transporter [Brevundimonas sp.]